MEPSVRVETYALGLPDLPASNLQRKLSQKYSKLACFKGKHLSLNQQAINKVSKVITSDVNKANVDRLAKSMSPNSCENFLGQLTKHMECKRKYFASSLEVIVLFVAGV